jgi:hypothetical protein
MFLKQKYFSYFVKKALIICIVVVNTAFVGLAQDFYERVPFHYKKMATSV